MENSSEFNEILLSVGFVGMTLIIIGFFLWKYPPKKVNHLYGYRTRSSMKSQESWDHAQAFSAREMIKQGVLLVFLGGVLMLFRDLTLLVSITIFMILLLGSFLVVIARTERSLKDKFK